MPYDAGHTRRGYRRSAWGGNNRITTRPPFACHANARLPVSETGTRFVLARVVHSFTWKDLATD